MICESELAKQLEIKIGECEMAARIGKSLLDENEDLKLELQSLREKVDKNSMFEPELVQGIQMSLIKQNREVSFKLQQEIDIKVSLQQENSNLADELASERKKCLNLKRKVESTEAQLWEISQDLGFKNEMIQDRDADIIRLQKLLKGVASKQDQILHPTPDAKAKSAIFVNSSTQTDEMPLQQVANEMPQELALNNNSDKCENCETLQFQIRNLESDNTEIQRLLDQAYEAMENLQNESFLTSRISMDDNQSELADISFNPPNIEITTPVAVSPLIVKEMVEGTPTNSNPIESKFSNPMEIEKMSPCVIREAFPQNKMQFQNTVQNEANNELEDLTYTMIGSWFIKYNRFQKKPQLRFVWINPYKRLLNWAEHPPSGDFPNVKCRSEYIVAFQWADAPKAHQNYPPTSENAIYIAIPSRVIKLVPVSWQIHDSWIGGLGFLLKKWKRMEETPGNFKKLERQSLARSPNDSVEILSDSDVTSRHRRVHTIISTSNKKLSTPNTIRKQHYRKTTSSVNSPNFLTNPFVSESREMPNMFNTPS